MSAIEIQAAIKRLNSDDFSQLAAWIEEEKAREWDEQIARDARAGKLDALIEEARQDFEAGRCRKVSTSGLF